MPIPRRKPGEDANEYIARGMKDKTMKKEFPNRKQRLAVLYDMLDRYARRKLGSKYKEKYFLQAIIPIATRTLGSVGSALARSAGSAAIRGITSSIGRSGLSNIMSNLGGNLGGGILDSVKGALENIADATQEALSD